MHLSAVHDTTPLTLFFSSAWNGQAATQKGSTQCMHWRFTKANVPPSPSFGLYSLMMFLVNEFRSFGAWCSESTRVSGSSPLASAHATTHDLQPMHFVESYNIPTASRGGSGTCSCAGLTTAPPTAAAAPPMAPILNRSRRVTDMTYAPAPLALSAGSSFEAGTSSFGGISGCSAADSW